MKTNLPIVPQPYSAPRCANIDIVVERGYDFSSTSTEEAPEKDYGSF
jgi:hypothetical protein